MREQGKEYLGKKIIGREKGKCKGPEAGIGLMC